MAKKNGAGAKKNGSGHQSGSSTAVKAPPVTPERWGEEPDEHDYPAAASYLSLICDPSEVRRLVTALKAAPIVHHQAKDLLRASGLALLPTDNFHVASDLAKVARGERLSPVLLMRGDFRRGVPLTIADGYHRVCASYHLDENADIPCHLVDHKGPTAVPPGSGWGPGSRRGRVRAVSRQRRPARVAGPERGLRRVLAVGRAAGPAAVLVCPLHLQRVVPEGRQPQEASDGPVA